MAHSWVQRLELIVLAVLAAGPVEGQSGERLPRAYMIDAAHSSVAFRVRFMGLSTVRGEFSDFAGTVLLGETPERSAITVIVQTKSIDTHATSRDEHLRSPDWLDAKSHPVISFTSTRIERTAAGLMAEGDLMLHGVTRTVRVPVTQLHEPTGDAWRNQRLAYQAEFRISRRDFGIAGGSFWNSEFDPGRFAVADSITLELELSAIIPNTAAWTVPHTDSLVAVVEAKGVERMISEYLAVRDTVRRPDANAIFVTAAKLQQRGRRAEAIRLYSLGVEHFADSPMRPMVLALIGENQLEAGHREEAERSFRRSLELDPFEPRARSWLRWLGVSR